MGEQIGKYRLLRQLGKGGMAEVFLARAIGPELFQKNVAIKRILGHLTSEERFVTMFLDEARLVARFNHPNIAQVFELGEEDGQYYVVMEYLEGRTIADLVKAVKKAGTQLPLDLSLKIVSQTCDALAYAHTRTTANGTPLGIIHRDMSPQNIMLTYAGTVKLLDFGIAKAATSQHQTEATVIRGKVSYMSPEQIGQNLLLDQRTDIFSLGVVLFEMVYGALPFGGSAANEILAAIVRDEPIRPPGLATTLPADLDDILTRALQKDRNHRYQTAREMQQDLDRILLHRRAIVDSQVLSDFLAELLPPGKPEPSYSPQHAITGQRTPARAEGSSDPVFAAREHKDPQPVVTTEERPAHSRWLQTILTAGVISLLALVVVLFWSTRMVTVTELAPAARQHDPEDGPKNGGSAGAMAAPTDVERDASDERASADSAGGEASRLRSKDPRPKVTRSGTVRFFVEPSTEVSIDGRPHGRTPIVDPIELSAGKHVLEMSEPELGIRHRREVQIRPGQEVRVQKTFERGEIMVFVLPFGEVSVDGKRIGLTPLDGPISLYEGRHVVHAVCDRTGKQKTQEVIVEAGSSHRINIDLR